MHEDPNFKSPVDVVLWASRLYLAHKVNDHEPPTILEQTLAKLHQLPMYTALQRVLDRLLVSANGKLVLHRGSCPQAAPHEQAMITGLRCLQKQYELGYNAAMAFVVPPTVIRLMLPDMEIVASALSDMERFWPSNGSFPASSRSSSLLGEQEWPTLH